MGTWLFSICLTIPNNTRLAHLAIQQDWFHYDSCYFLVYRWSPWIGSRSCGPAQMKSLMEKDPGPSGASRVSVAVPNTLTHRASLSISPVPRKLFTKLQHSYAIPLDAVTVSSKNRGQLWNSLSLVVTTARPKERENERSLQPPGLTDFQRLSVGVGWMRGRRENKLLIEQMQQ